MKSFPLPLLTLVTAAFCGGALHASFFVDPTGGTVLWGDDATYDDAAIRGRALGFDFTFFDNEPVGTIDASTNGNLNFTGDSDYSNEKLLAPILRISPLWDDLELTKGSGDSVVEKTVPGKLYAVTWRAHEHGSKTTQHSFQVVLFGAAQRINGLDFAAGDIVFSYGAIGASFAKDLATVALDPGDGGTVVPLPGASTETGLILHSEAGLLPTGAGGFILFHPDESGGYIASTHINRVPQAVDDTQYSGRRGPFAIDVLANDLDPDGDPLTIVSVTQGSFGNVGISAQGTVSYLPGLAFGGTDIFTYTVRDPYGLTSTARVTLLPFGAGRGVFDGLIADAPTDDDPAPPPTAEGSGYLRIMLGATGAFSGTLNFGGFSQALRGVFDSRGGFMTTFDRVVDGDKQTVTVTLHLDLADELHPLTGTVSDGTVTSRILAARSRYIAGNFSAPQAGRYTVLLRPDDTGSGPAGIGYAQMKVNASGATVLGGKLGDGRPFSFGGLVTPEKSSAFYLRIPAGKGARAGSLFGKITFDDSHTTCDCSASLSWFMPDVGDVLGFEAAPLLVGCRYRAPDRGGRVLQVADAPWNAAIDVGAGQIVHLLTLDASNKVTVEPPNAEHLTLSINSQTGTFTGAFIEETLDDPPVRKRHPIGGAFLKKSNEAGGLYLDLDGASEPITIAPALPAP